MTDAQIFFDTSEAYYELPTTGKLQDAMETLSESGEYRAAACAFAEAYAERLRERVEALTQALTELADEVESMESLDGRVTVACWQKLEAARNLVEEKNG